MDLVLIGLMGFLILGSIVALEMRHLLSAVIAVGVVGLGLSILFLLLGAPDIAITQVVVDVLVVTVLIRTATRTQGAEKGARTDKLALVFGLLLMAVFLGFTIHAFGALPEFGNPGERLSDAYLVSGPERTGATNIVTAILLDFRAYDTLGEATVILAAVLGVLVVLRKLPRRKEQAEPEPDPDDAGEPELAEVTHA